MTYEVTITNVSAPGGTWRFGSLTWQDQNYRRVRSPIAVKAQAVSVPDEVAATGASGEGTFDVAFGYDGPYTPQVHGLNDAALTVFNGLADDPGNSFAFLGAGTTIAFLAEFPAGTAFARFELFNEYTDGNDDFDMYLYYCPDNSCSQIDSSTNVDSNESIEVTFPQNDPTISDRYLVFLHAYETDGPDANLIMFDYTFGVVDDAGNLTVEGPASGAIGTTAPINFGWSGLNRGPGFKQLGGISHSDPSGIQDLTVISVDNDTGTGYCTFFPCP